MVQQRTRVKVGDNSGIRELRCLVVYKGMVRDGSKVMGGGMVGEVMRATVRKYRAGTKWRRGIKVKAVRVCRKKEVASPGGIWARVGVNGAVVVSQKLEPRANRTRRVMAWQRRRKGCAKVLARATYIV